MHCLQALPTRKGIKHSSREDVAIVEFGHKAANCPNKKSGQKKGSKDKPEKKRCKRLKGTTKKRVTLICQNLDATIAVKWDILHGTAQSPARMLILLLEKMNKTGNSLK